MLESLVKLHALLEPRDRFKVLVLVLVLVGLMIVTAFMQMAGIGSIMPFLAVLSDPSVVQRNAGLNDAFTRLGFTSTETFLYFLGIVAFGVFMTGTALQALTNWAITRFSHLQQYELSRRLMADYPRRPYTFFLTHHIDQAAVEQAARLANLHEFVIGELPKGYDTIIGERGVRLSGGQRQRIGIARALYRDPAVLLFDEATSALDNATERAVMEAIHNLSGEKTIILIAHRLSTVKPCERIYVMANGRVVEQGSWGELSISGEQFRRLAAGVA
ncbi:MAG: ATP-binding cassette domain-containing protein [Candidatus Competibacteraceae bacterium]|nr:MAG: ATP-binding cassette domain-containing protein [Candidatus Competibacteraceae bacterium]